MFFENETEDTEGKKKSKQQIVSVPEKLEAVTEKLSGFSNFQNRAEGTVFVTQQRRLHETKNS